MFKNSCRGWLFKFLSIEILDCIDKLKQEFSSTLREAQGGIVPSGYMPNDALRKMSAWLERILIGYRYIGHSDAVPKFAK